LFAIAHFLAIPGYCKGPIALLFCYVDIDESVILAICVLGRDEVSARIVQFGELVDFEDPLPLLIVFALTLNEPRKLIPLSGSICVYISVMVQLTRLCDDDQARSHGKSYGEHITAKNV
jgi:hypothetical protein